MIIYNYLVQYINYILFIYIYTCMVDPVPIIESLMSSVLGGSANSLEIERLKSELKQYDDEFQHLKNQDVTIRRLEDQLNDLRDNQNIKVLKYTPYRFILSVFHVIFLSSKPFRVHS